MHVDARTEGCSVCVGGGGVRLEGKNKDHPSPYLSVICHIMGQGLPPQYLPLWGEGGTMDSRHRIEIWPSTYCCSFTDLDRPVLHCKENSTYVFLFWELRSLSPN